MLDMQGGLFPMMRLPVLLFIGGRLDSGNQAVPWIHLGDQIGALRFLLENDQMRGEFNLISPTSTSNKEFMRPIASASHRPYWFPTPTILLCTILVEISSLVLEGGFSLPKRLLECRYEFRFPTIEAALQDLFKK